jgi:NDP-sugar pyrophosphorylase family protein
MDAFTFDTGWYDIGDRASYIEANRHYANADTWKGDDVVIENSTVKDSVLFDEVRIVDSSISGCVIDRGTHLDGVLPDRSRNHHQAQLNKLLHKSPFLRDRSFHRRERGARREQEQD